MRNSTFMHTARDDSLLRTMRFVSKHEDAQIYGAIFLKAMTNQAMLDSIAYKTYYAIASGAKPPKSKKPKTKTDLAISSEETPTKKKPTKAKKYVPSKKNPAATPKPTKKKALIKADRGKGLNVLSEVALSEAARLKEATKRIKKDFHISQSSGSGDGTDFQSRVPIEEQRKIFGTDEGIDDDDEDDTKDDEGNDDGDDSDGNDDNDDNDGDNDDDNDGNDDYHSDQERTELDRYEIHNLNQFNKEHEDEEEENVDDITDKEDDEENEEDSDDGEELYKDVNVNLRKEDVEMTDADQGGADQHNVLQESGFEQEEEDAHVTLTTIHDTQKTEGLMQSSSVSSNFIEKLLNFENVSPADNEIASLMDTTVRTEEPSGQTSTLFTVPITVIPTTIPPPPHFFNPLPQQTTPTPTPTTSEVTTAFPLLPDFASVFRFNDRVTNLERELSKMKQVDQEEVNTQLPQILPKAVLDFATPVIERNVTESLEVVVLAKSSSQPKSTYEAAASLSEYELTKILLDKMEESKSHLRSDYKKKHYDALVKSYNTDKDRFNTYGEVFTLKSSRDDKDKDQDLFARSDREMKRRKSSKEADHTVDDSRVQKNQEFSMSNNDEQLEDEAAPKNDWFKKPERPPTPDPDWNKRQHTKAATYEIKWIEDMVPNLWSPIKVVYDKHTYWGTSHWVTRLKIMKKYDYGHLDEIKVRREDQQLYTFKEGDFPRLRLQDIEDMLLLLVQQQVTNLLIKTFDLQCALHYVHQLNFIQSDGTLNDVRTALHDIASGIRMEYLPKRKWSGLDKRRASVMIQDIDKQLFQRRSKRENKGKVLTEMELVLEQTQQGTSHEVSVSTEGVEELKRKVKKKDEKKEALLTLRQKLGLLRFYSPEPKTLRRAKSVLSCFQLGYEGKASEGAKLIKTSAKDCD
ncbi:hypothetical protein Tco_1367926 [Tanacetum coccineum]